MTFAARESVQESHTVAAGGAILVRPRPQANARARIICLPYAGGGAAAWHPWLPLLPDGIELAMVQLPGREVRLREQPFRRMDEAIGALLPALDALLDRPYLLFGHSMGALMAFALARALRREGAPAACPARRFRAARAATCRPGSAAAHAARRPLCRRAHSPLQRHPRVLLEDVELLRLFLPALRADLELLESYTYEVEPPLDCPILALGGTEDSRATAAELAAWQQQSTGAFQMQQFAGGHFYINDARSALVKLLAGTLATVAPTVVAPSLERRAL